MGPRRDTNAVYGPWYAPQLLSIEGAHWTVGSFLAFLPYFLGNSFFSEVSTLVLPQLSITIAFSVADLPIGQQGHDLGAAHSKGRQKKKDNKMTWWNYHGKTDMIEFLSIMKRDVYETIGQRQKN